MERGAAAVAIQSAATKALSWGCQLPLLVIA
jgi:hypothetical protein